LTVDRKHCPARSGWKILLVEGGLVAAVPKSAAATASFMTTTGNATVSGRPGARWKVKYAKRRTMIHALSGTVLVAGKVLKPGQTAKI
jgi:hypothetical protein